MKAYPQCKDSGVPWLEHVPEHWEVFRLGSQFAERKQKVSDKDFAPLSVTKKGILPQLVTAAKSNDGDNRKKVCSGDFVINSRSDRKGSSGVSPLTGSVSLINTVLTPLSLDGRYAHNFFRSHAFKEEFYRVGRGIVADLWSTKYADMRTIMIPVPTQDEQQQISRYLDWQTSKINKFIKAKKKLIALLKEQKQNIIHYTITRGLDQNVEFKPSGLEWLGDVPKHWDVIRVGNIINLTTGFPFPSAGFSQNKEDTKLLRGVNVTPSGIRWDSVVYWKRTLDDGLDHFQLREGDIVLGMDRPIISSGVRASKIKSNDTESLLLQRVARLRPNSNVNGEFLLLLISSQMFADYMAPIFTGVSVPHLSPDQICKYKVALPPVNEQELIISHIEKETALIDKTIARTEREIELIQEYRTRLVSDVVTGKVDVRSVEIPDFEPVEAELEAQDDEESEDEPITEGIDE